MELFVTGKADRVELLYHHFKNMATQVVTHKTYLPLSLSDTEAAETATDYILEPSAEELRNRLFPKLLNLTILYDPTRHLDRRARRPYDGYADRQTTMRTI